MGFTGDWQQALAWALGVVTRELTLFAASGVLVFGLDDLAIDILWIVRAWWRHRVVFTRFDRATMASLPPPENPGRLAIFVPAWRESAVIAPMLRAALDRWDGADFRIFIGTYPNDPPTAEAIAALGDPRLVIVGGRLTGPTSKAECLNRVWRAMLAEEEASGMPFKGIVLHDAEDVVHPQELALFGCMLERFDFVQIPVFPLGAHGTGWWARTLAAIYGDEFADGHGRQMVIREAIGAGVPSAGVGCAIERSMMASVAAASDGAPFDEGSLTEDYELGLAIAALGGRGAFVTIPPVAGALPVAVRAHFPERWGATIRQKSRWIIGHALAGWDRLGWHGGVAERWMRFRDRKAPLAAMVVAAGYASLALNIFGWSIGLDLPKGLLRTMLLVTLISMIWRLLIRAIVVRKVYGLWAGLWSMPRMIVASAVSIAATWRAVRIYRPGKRLTWDKTEHVFPDDLPCG